MPSIEKHIFDYLSERAAAAVANDPAFNTIPLPPATLSAIRAQLVDNFEVLPDEFAQMAKARGVRVGEATARVAPNFGGTDLEHFDALVVLICFRAVERTERSARANRREEVIALANALGTLFIAEPDMRVLSTGEPRVANSRPLWMPRGADNTDGKPYAVANIQLVVNETGEIDFTRRR
jgi:hypothetical protein